MNGQQSEKSPKPTDSQLRTDVYYQGNPNANWHAASPPLPNMAIARPVRGLRKASIPPSNYRPEMYRPEMVRPELYRGPIIMQPRMPMFPPQYVMAGPPPPGYQGYSASYARGYPPKYVQMVPSHSRMQPSSPGSPNMPSSSIPYRRPSSPTQNQARPSRSRRPSEPTPTPRKGSDASTTPLPNSKENDRPRRRSYKSNEPIVELDDDFQDCVQDFLVMVEDQEPYLKEYTETLLSRWARRTIRNYQVAGAVTKFNVDSFAAAAVGARRYLVHTGNKMNEKTSIIEQQLAKTLAILAVEAAFIAWRNANGAGDGIRVPFNSEQGREESIQRLMKNYLSRADNWTPQAAAKAAAARKRRQRRSRFISVFLEEQPETFHSELDPVKSPPADYRRRLMSNESNLLSQPSSPRARATSPKGRRGSAEALLQSVLDECESLIDVLNEK